MLNTRNVVSVMLTTTLLRTTDGYRKLKGAYVSDLTVGLGYDMPIVAEVAEKALMGEIDIRDELEKCDDPYKFCKAQKVGNQFTIEHHSLKDSALQVEKMQKTNRYFASMNGGKLFKNKEGRLHDLIAGYRVTMFNDYFDSDDYQIDYGYYAAEVRKLIRPFDFSQLSLF